MFVYLFIVLLTKNEVIVDKHVLGGLVCAAVVCATLHPVVALAPLGVSLARSAMWCSRSVARLENESNSGSWKETALRVGKWSLVILALVGAVALTIGFGGLTGTILTEFVPALLAGDRALAVLSGLAIALSGYCCYASAATVKDAAQTCFRFARTQRGDDRQPCLVK